MGLQRISHGYASGSQPAAAYWKGPSLTPGAKPQLRLNRNPIAQLSKIRQQTFSGIIVRAPLCEPEQAQQQSGRIGSSNTRPGPRSPPQAKASAMRSWPASDELANLVLVALLHPQQSLASSSVGAMLGASNTAKTARRIARSARSIGFRIFDMAGLTLLVAP